MSNWTAGRAIAAVLGACLVAQVFAGCAPDEEPATDGVEVRAGQDVAFATADGRVEVQIPGAAISGEGRLTVTQTDAPSGSDGWAVELTNGASLVGTATLRFHGEYAADEPAPLVTSSADGETFVPEGAVTLDGNTAVVQTNHFSTWFVTQWSAALNWARSALDALYTDAGKQPTCSGEDTVRDAGYSVTSDTGNSVYWCLGLDDSGAPQLTLANGRGYTVAAESTPGLSPVDVGGGDLVSWAQSLLKESASLPQNEVTLVGPGGSLSYAVGDEASMAVRVQPSVGAYLVSAAQYVVDTFGFIMTATGKPLGNAAISGLVSWESCFAGYSSMWNSTVETPTQASTYLSDAVGTAFGCLETAIIKAGLKTWEVVFVAGVTWVLSGVHAALNGAGAAAQTALNPNGYTVYITGPGGTGEDYGLPDVLSQKWCTVSGDSCWDPADYAERFPDMFLYSEGPDELTADATTYALCLEDDLPDGCTMAATVFLTYFPQGVAWSCVEASGFPGCDPDYSTAHDVSRARLVIPANHQQDELYHDSEPMYQVSR